MDKRQVLIILKKIGVNQIEPDVVEYVRVTKRSTRNIGKILDSEAVCISNNAGLTLKLQLNKDGSVIKLYESELKIAEITDIKLLDDLEHELISALANHDDLVVMNCLSNSKWVSLMHLSDQDIEYLSHFSAWRYDDPKSGKYSSITLIFDNGRLIDFNRKWAPF